MPARATATEESLWPLLRRVEPDVVLLDYHLPKATDCSSATGSSSRSRPPGVIIFSAYASPELLLPARLAKADGLLNKGVGARELFETIRPSRPASG